MSATSHLSSGSVNASVAPSTGPSSSTRPQPTQAEQTADARKAFISSLGVAARGIDEDLQSRAKSIHTNAQAVTKQEKQLQESTKKLAKENKEMEKWLQKSNKKLAEVTELLNFDLDGDGLEADLDDLEAMLDAMDAESAQGKEEDETRNGTGKPK